jgi:hypothetical protein
MLATQEAGALVAFFVFRALPSYSTETLSTVMNARAPLHPECARRQDHESWRAHNLNLDRHSAIKSLPDFAAALAIPDLAALIFSAYCKGVDFKFLCHPSAPIETLE